MQNTKAQITKTSIRLFLQKSFREVTMNELCRETGLSKGAFYHYFDSKEQLFLECVNSSFSSLIDISYDRFSEESLFLFYQDYIANMKKVGLRFIEISEGEDGELPMNSYSLILDAIKYFPDFREKMQRLNQEEMTAWLKIIETAKQAHEIKDGMPDIDIAKMFIHSGSSVGMKNMIIGDLRATAVELEQLWNSFYSLLKR
jgi:TetR/AcrR family transcriptional regulator, transcriptional repressor for nem operon